MTSVFFFCVICCGGKAEKGLALAYAGKSLEMGIMKHNAEESGREELQIWKKRLPMAATSFLNIG